MSKAAAVAFLFLSLAGVSAEAKSHKHKAHKSNYPVRSVQRTDRYNYDYGYRNRQGLPPGLEKRNGNLPPGLEKRRNLPPGLDKRVEPVYRYDRIR
jgi:hypothetical protein